MRNGNVNWQELYAQYQISGLSISGFYRDLVSRYGKENLPSRSTFFRNCSAIQQKINQLGANEFAQAVQTKQEDHPIRVAEIPVEDLQNLGQSLKHPDPVVTKLMQSTTIRIYCPGQIVIEAPVLSVESLILTLIRRG